jgi:hypothetical protein
MLLLGFTILCWTLAGNFDFLFPNYDRSQYHSSMKKQAKDPAAVELGRKGGEAVSARYGSKHFDWLQSLRKNRKGGRPRRNKKG